MKPVETSTATRKKTISESQLMSKSNEQSNPEAIQSARQAEANKFFSFIANNFPPVPFSAETIQNRMQDGFALDFIPAGLTFREPLSNIRNYYSLSLWFLKSKLDPDYPPFQDPPTPGRWVFYPGGLFLPETAMKSQAEQHELLKQNYGVNFVWPQAGELAYLLILNQKRTRTYLLENSWVRSGTPCGNEDLYLICVGYHHFDNLLIGYNPPSYKSYDLFACPFLIT